MNTESPNIGTMESRDCKEDQYPEFINGLKNHFDSVVGKDTKLFTTNIEGLFEVFLAELESESRQQYVCRSCRQFVDQYGGLVTISEDGSTTSALWNESEIPEFFSESIKVMRRMVSTAKVTGVFVSDKEILGHLFTNDWQHMSATLPSSLVNHSKVETAEQVMAKKQEEFNMLMRSLAEFKIGNIDQAVTLLRSGAIHQPERCLGVTEWMQELHNKRSEAKTKDHKENIVWLAVASAPSGFCHIKTSVVGSLLEDLSKNLPFSAVKQKFEKKMNPLVYQRPQVAPTAGNTAQAEKLIKTLGIENSLLRRLAQLEELETLWKPKVREEKRQGPKDGVFGHLKTKGAEKKPQQMNIPAVTMTWEKFCRTVIPSAESIEYLVENKHANFAGLVTAAHEDAPPILQWDSPEQRNPFSWYVYVSGSLPSQWGLSLGYQKVTGVCLQPSMWNGSFDHQGKSVFFILDGAKDRNKKNEKSGNALFPAFLKEELREVRATIEAYSKSADMTGYDQASANGIRLQEGSSKNWDATFRVTTTTVMTLYKLDRWD